MHADAHAIHNHVDRQRTRRAPKQRDVDLHGRMRREQSKSRNKKVGVNLSWLPGREAVRPLFRSHYNVIVAGAPAASSCPEVRPHTFWPYHADWSQPLVAHCVWLRSCLKRAPSRFTWSRRMAVALCRPSPDQPLAPEALDHGCFGLAAPPELAQAVSPWLRFPSPCSGRALPSPIYGTALSAPTFTAQLWLSSFDIGCSSGPFKPETNPDTCRGGQRKALTIISPENSLCASSQAIARKGSFNMPRA